MKRKILILCTKGYEVTDKASGEINSGVSIYYHGLEDEYVPFDPNVPAQNIVAGIMPEKASLDLSVSRDIVKVPAIYEGSFILKTGADLKPKLVLNAFKYVSDFEIVNKKSDKVKIDK